MLLCLPGHSALKLSGRSIDHKHRGVSLPDQGTAGCTQLLATWSGLAQCCVPRAQGGKRRAEDWGRLRRPVGANWRCDGELEGQLIRGATVRRAHERWRVRRVRRRRIVSEREIVSECTLGAQVMICGFLRSSANHVGDEIAVAWGVEDVDVTSGGLKKGGGDLSSD